MQSVLRRIEAGVDPVVDEEEGAGEEVEEEVAAGEVVEAVLADGDGCRKHQLAIILIRWTNHLCSIETRLDERYDRLHSTTCRVLSASTTASSTSTTATSFAVEILRLPVV